MFILRIQHISNQIHGGGRDFVEAKLHNEMGDMNTKVLISPESTSISKRSSSQRNLSLSPTQRLDNLIQASSNDLLLEGRISLIEYETEAIYRKCRFQTPGQSPGSSM